MKPALELIWVVPSLASLGGSEYAAVTFARLVAGDGHRVRLLTGPEVHSAWQALLQVEGLTVVQDPDGGAMAMADTLAHLLAVRCADLIQFMPIEAHCLAWLDRRTRVPVIGWEPTDLSPRCWWLPSALKQRLRELDGLLVLNPDAALHAWEHYAYRGDVSILANTLVSVPATVATRQRDGLVVGCISRLSAEKGLEFLLAAFALLLERCPRATLRLWGEGEDQERLENLALMLGIEASVEFAGGFEPFGGIDDVAASADVFVLSSLFEGAPVALLELAARGRPLVASATSGARWVCGQAYPWLTAVGDTRAMADALADALGGQGHKALGGQLRQRFEQQFAPARALATLNAAYARVLAAGPRP
ncbi:glycosyltransferase [Pseudomonas entomophila]|uniref:glycosyltransferase n=1 Tax=Pseudomonas entomophila TaxID=312306 RepID=UPI002405E6F0|nr:glycosyltransferase [Pseudomonas entomophila]MDF9620129.1 glycosyltransferase [Pseudomonas entomophila]